ncbi:pilus assembly protein TadG-related protein [Burkholderia anthina]|uniref:pilus assembly protein TadG-related protein n=1 Tax=Burkholderia anthina TaxID=179879 RepID=UPI001FC87A3F|nr:pilus assembly protein TadG-related protein [Burkholderia anthina]
MRADQSHVASRGGGAGWPGRRRQRGSFAVMAAIWIAIAIIVLGVIDIGRFYAERRQMQAAADLASLSAVSQVAADQTCVAAKAAVQQVATPSANSVPANATISVTCGVWAAPQAGSSSATFTRISGDQLATNGQCDGLSAGTATGAAANAVCVTVSEPVTGIFRSGAVGASAIAKATPTDTFTLTTSLLSLNGGLANKLLQALTGSPNVLSLNAVDYQGLAQVNLKLGNILANLPVGTSTSVLNGTVTLGQLANAMVQAATQQNLAGLNLNVLNAIVAGLCTSNVCGGPQIALGQLVSAAVSGGSSAVDASVNAFGLLSTALQVANGTNPIIIKSFLVQTPTALAPLLNMTVSASVSLAGTPPATATGPAGPSSCGTSNCTTNTSTAQGQVLLSTKISLLSTCSDGSLVYSGNACSNGSAPVPVAAVNLPVSAYVAPAAAGLPSVTCTANTKTATVNTQTGVLVAMIGGSPPTTQPSLQVPSGPPTYTPDGNSIQLLSVSVGSLLNLTGLTNAPLLGPLLQPILALVGLNSLTAQISLKTGKLVVPIANQNTAPLTFTYSMATTPPTLASSAYACPASSTSNPYMLCVGTDQFLAPATQSLLNNSLSLKLSANGGLTAALTLLLNPLLDTLTGPLLSLLSPILIPLVMQPLDSLLTSVTGLLGLGLGNAYVTNAPDAIKCGDPMLVK